MIKRKRHEQSLQDGMSLLDGVDANTIGSSKDIQTKDPLPIAANLMKSSGNVATGQIPNQEKLPRIFPAIMVGEFRSPTTLGVRRPFDTHRSRLSVGGVARNQNATCLMQEIHGCKLCQLSLQRCVALELNFQHTKTYTDHAWICWVILKRLEPF